MSAVLKHELASSGLIDKRNKRLLVNSYPTGTEPWKLADSLIAAAKCHDLGKIWLWALPEDVPDFLRSGFQLEGHLFKGKYNKFVVSLAHFPQRERGKSNKLHSEDEVLKAVSAARTVSRTFVPQGISLGILNQMYAKQVSQLLTRVFSSYPTPVGDPQYIRCLMQKRCLFAGAFDQDRLIGVAAAYVDAGLGRCEMTDCAVFNEYRGYSLTERLLRILEKEVAKLGPYTLYTLARAQSVAMNRVFFKLGYQYTGRLINNCHISGSFQDMNLWVNINEQSINKKT
jgi:putative beta-lysine N-acetyltransferase